MIAAGVFCVVFAIIWYWAYSVSDTFDRLEDQIRWWPSAVLAGVGFALIALGCWIEGK